MSDPRDHIFRSCIDAPEVCAICQHDIMMHTNNPQGRPASTETTLDKDTRAERVAKATAEMTEQEMREILASCYERQMQTYKAESCRAGFRTYDICAALDMGRRLLTQRSAAKAEHLKQLQREIDVILERSKLIDCDLLRDCLDLIRRNRPNNSDIND